MSLASAPSDDNDPHPPVTLDSQRISIGPMTMMCFTRLQILKKFPSPEKQHVKGLNYEAVIPVHFPSPAWIKATEYAALQPQTHNDDDGNNVNCAFFSLNLSIYNQEIIPSDWDDTWFFLSGQVHPYALTWEVDADDDTGPNSEMFNYTIAPFIVRDYGYQPISPRTLNFDSIFHIIPPIVTFTGSVVGSGQTLLRGDPPSDLSETQQKCCGFVQLSTFITPGNPTKPPYRRAHQFQLFVIFPIHVNPWMIRCKKMMERPNTQFQPNTLFHCTGRLAGFLDHRIMVHPPSLAQDYVFIIVPENWNFFAKSSKNTISTPSPTATPAKQSSADPRSKFMSPSKRKHDQLSDPAPKTSPDSGASVTISSPQTPSTSHTTDMSGILASPPYKRPRTENTLPTLLHNNTPSVTTLHTSSHTLPNAPSQSDNWSRTNYAIKSQPPRPQPAFTTNQLPQSATQAPTLPPDDRPHRHRQPTKKVLNID